MRLLLIRHGQTEANVNRQLDTAHPGLPLNERGLSQAEALVASLARALSNPDLARSRFRIEGHTDTVGAPAMNQSLSERRAATVRDMLVTRYGLAPARLEAVGLGETQLLVATPDGRAEARNRRVQVINLGE